jgi:hypothetical protein
MPDFLTDGTFEAESLTATDLGASSGSTCL